MKTLRKADLHLHSHVSYDVPDLESLSPRALFEKALGNPDPARRMDFFTLTDHDTMDGYRRLIRELPEADRRLVIPGVEHTLRDPDIGFSIHVNLFMLHPDTYARLRREVVSLDDLLWFCREHGIFAQYNHPTWFERHELRRGQVAFGKVKHIADCFDVLELNAGRPRRLNEATEQLAWARGKVLTSNSDSHSGDVGLACNMAPGDTPREFLQNVWTGLGRVQASSMTYRGMLRVVHHLIDGVLDDRQGLLLAESMLHNQHRLLEQLTTRLVNAGWLRRPGPGREGLRLLLKQLSRPLVIGWLRSEDRLARELDQAALATPPLPERARAA
jgi:predicted metal-dependent phosphoesterase TrpH